MEDMMKTYETEYGIGKPGVSQGRKSLEPLIKKYLHT